MKYILQTDCGVTCEMEIDESGQPTCTWSPAPPYTSALAQRVIPQYRKWRDEIYREYAQRTGKRILVVEI